MATCETEPTLIDGERRAAVTASHAHPQPGAVRPPAPSGGLHIDPIASLGAHPLLAAAIAIFILAAGLPIANKKGAYQYSASAIVYVSPRFLANLQDDKEFELQSNSQYREYVQQQIRTITRYDIVQEALTSLGPQKNGFIAKNESLRSATERLQAALIIAPILDTYQVSITLSGPKKEILAPTVNAVVAAFLKHAKVEELYGSDQRLANLTKDSEDLRREITEKQALRTQIGQELGVTTFTNNFINPYDKLLEDEKTALAQSQRAFIQADASLQSVDPARRAEGTRALHALAQELASKDTALTSLQSNLNQRRANLLSTISGMRADHPVHKAAENELADLEKELSRVYNKLLADYSSMLLDQRQAEAYKTAEIEKRLKAATADLQAQASWFTTKFQEGMALGFDIERARKRLDTIQDRMDFLHLEGRAPGFTRVFTEAKDPLIPSKGGRKVLFAAVIFLSVLLACVASMAVDLLDPRLHVPADMEKVLGFATIGWFLRKQDAGSAFAREQIFRLASRISQDRIMYGSRVFLFTGIKAGAGTTSIVTETASALTRMGAATLVVEANAYRADPRYRAPDERGLAVVLRGFHDLEAAVVPGNDQFPDCIPVGEVDHERHLPDVLKLIELLRATEASYEVVLLDAPPLLVSADSEILAQSADVTVLVAEAESTSKKELQKVARTLERLHPRSVAAVLNQVKAQAKGGFGRKSRYEFEHGFPPPPSKWSSPWLWR